MQNSENLKVSTSRIKNTSHYDKENIVNKIPKANTKEESLLFKRTVRRKRNESKTAVKLNLNLQERNILEDENELISPLGNESLTSNNDLNTNIYFVSTQESSNSTTIDSQGSLDQLKLANWGLPRQILKKYEARGIKSMFPWQVECLSNERIIRENRNLVYSAPTSAGKTLVAEILLLKTVLERKKKAIFILPFVSVVREKMFYFQDLLSDSGIRVEGFMGSVNPAGGFQSVNIAIATIEKANSLINRLLEEEDLMSIGAVVIDELHLLGDPNRGYILELLLTKLRYITLKYEDIKIQLIGMSATLPNLSMLADWLDAELYKTDFRPIPLDEQCKIETIIYNRELELIRELPVIPEIINDVENIIQLCIETIEGGHGVLIFCPTKNWCEKLALQAASAFLSIGRSNSHLGQVLQTTLDATAIFETLEQLKRTPTGLDSVLKNTVSFGVAFHHAGLTIDERDIIEGSFRTGSLKVLVATSTLSTGVNLPARRVIIRSPCFHGKPLDTLSYQQMSGRAGRMGKDTAGESILICKSNEKAVAVSLLTASLKPIESCLEDSGPLMRSLLEAIASDIVRTPEDLDCYIKCTFINLQEEGEGSISNAVKEAVQFLVINEFLMLQESEEEHLKRWSATALGKACLSASVPPREGLFLFEELLKARKCIALDTELHVVYLVTPYNAGSQIGQIDWMNYLEMWSTLSEPEKRVAKLVGVEERFLLSAVRGSVAPGKSLNIHKRFYTALALYELVREIPLHKVCKKFGCGRGLLQGLQQSSSTYAGMMTSFCKQLNWNCMELLVAQFQTRLQFGVSRDLMDLLRLPSLNGLRARSLYKEGITSVVELAVASELEVERALHKALPFESEREQNGEGQFELARQNKVRTTFITGKDGLTTREAALLLIREARTLLQNELGVRDVQWKEKTPSEINISQGINISNSEKHEQSSDNQEKIDTTSDNQQQTLNSQNLSNLSSKKIDASKNDKNITRNRQELTIERTKISQKSPRNENIEESSHSILEPLVLSENTILPISQKSVYEHIDKDVESALEEIIVNNILLEKENENINHESFESPNLFDSQYSVNDCSALEQNVLGSLRLSDFEATNISSRKQSLPSTQSNNQEIKTSITNDSPKLNTSSSKEKVQLNENLIATDLGTTFFEGSAFNTILGENQINLNVGNVQETLEIRVSDFELTAPEKRNSSPKNIQINENIPNISGIQISDFEVTLTQNKPKEKLQDEMKVENVIEISTKSDILTNSENHQRIDNQIENENNKNYLSGINASDFEITDKNDDTVLLKTDASDLNRSILSKRSLNTTIRTTKELLSGINLSDFLISETSSSNVEKIDRIQENQAESLKQSTRQSHKETPKKITREISNLSRIKSNTNMTNLEITKVKVIAKNSQEAKTKPDSLSFWDQDSWDGVQMKRTICGEKRKNENVTKNETLTKRKILTKDIKKVGKSGIGKRKFSVAEGSPIGMQSRKFSVAEGSPIASIETFTKRRTSIVTSDSDSDDMFVFQKKIKATSRTIKHTINNTNSMTIEPENLANTDFSKAGPSKIEIKNKTSVEKLIRSNLTSASSYDDSIVFSDDDNDDDESTIEKSVERKIPTLSNSRRSNREKWKPANIISSKRKLTLLKQKLIKRTDIALSIHCETIVEDKIIIGARIFGAENKETEKKLKHEKFIYKDKKICGVAISWGFQALYYIPLDNQPEIKVTLKERVNVLIEILTNSSMNVRCLLSRKVYKLFYLCCGIISSCKFIDPSVADWTLNSEGKSKNMNYLVAKYYPIAHEYYENRNVLQENNELTENESTKEAVLIWYITDVILKQLHEKSTTLLTTFKDVEMEVLTVLSRMELRGLGINLSALNELSDVIKREMSLLEKRAFYIAGKKFNFMSSSSVAQILGIQKGKRTSTSKAVLEQSNHPIAKLIISWRKLSTLQSLVVIPLLNEAENSRIHGTHINHTLTGRISMQEPNLQNIPKDFNSEDNTFVISIRMAFIPTAGNIMLSADYCQLELRVLAHFANDSVLHSIMNQKGTDIFKSISAKWNNIDENMVDDKIRQRTKQLCYGMIYGMGTKSLAESLSVTEDEAKEFLETFMKTYKGIRSWLSSVVERARIDGYVTTITKRYRIIPGIWSENRSEKSQAERQAVNTKIQGSAADIAKKAMVLIDEKLREEYPSSPVIFPAPRPRRKLRNSGSNCDFKGAYLVLQLHDELLFEVNAKDLHHVAALVKESMENAYSLEVPLPVKLKVGPAWGDLKEYHF